MSLVLLMFKQMQPLGMYESVALNEAHIAIAQYKNKRMMWFDRIPHVGEFVLFQAPQGGSSVFFKVYEVQHYPSEAANLLAPPSVPQSVIFLQPVLSK